MSDEAAWGDDMRDDDAEWADMEAEMRCEWCVNWRRSLPQRKDGKWSTYDFCVLARPLDPCEQYEREPGSDDDREGV